MATTQEEYDELRQQIQDQLVDYIPKYFASHALSSPAYCLFLLYDDGSSLDFTPNIEIGTKDLLLACEQGLKDGVGDTSNQGKAWRPHQCISSPFPGFPCPGERLTIVGKECNACYDFEFENNVAYSLRDTFTETAFELNQIDWNQLCLLYTSPSPRDRQKSRMPSSA